MTTLGDHSAYSKAAIILHWLIALLVIGQFVGMQYADTLERTDPSLGTVYMLHKSSGLTILAFTVLRLFIRLREGFPALPMHMAGWEVLLARTTHIVFYALLLIMPLSGWLFAVSAARGLDLFGLVPVPVLPSSEVVRELMHEAHEYGAWAFLVLFVLHVLGALKHHFLDRDMVLTRMLPLVRRRG
ncbi:MAG: cytochrome b [Pacificimonas sp.]